MSFAGLVLAGAPAGAALSENANSAEQLAGSLVARMTIEEKLPQLMNVAPAIPRLGESRWLF